ncbi:hypothetical protein [Calothrix rhizosoleniae]|uniref:hypothetical protein n=1 Tax=Calothrix rhizosoleniae TaxID=888997 RepID=UPI000B49AEEA|nr:hypothetical protein [Calothrix rhizosoleniae]
MTVQWISLLVTITLAFTGYILTYLNNLRLARRKDRLTLISKQLNDFYGPLFIASEAGAIAFQSIQKKIGLPSREVPQVDSKIYVEWRLWMENVFMPINIFREELILNHAHLIREEETPVCLLRFVAHVSAYKVVLKKWSEDDYSEHFSVIDFPSEILNYAKVSYRELKEEQIKLIGKSKVNQTSKRKLNF